MSEDFAKRKPEADIQRQDEGAEVEAHLRMPDAEEDKVAATEEGPDVEAHRLAPKAKP